MQHLKQIAINAGKQPLTWYLFVVTATLGVFFAPIQGKWNDRNTGQSLIALIPLLIAGEVLGSKVGSDLTMLRIRNHLARKLEIQEIAHEMNTIEAINQNELRQIAGDYTVGELQVRMAESQERITTAMAGGMAELPAAAESTDEPTSNALPAGGILPTEDLAKTTARAKRSTVMLAPSGCGKTSFTRYYIHHTNELFQTLVDFTVFDFKGDDDGFCGLEKSSSDYYVFNGHDTVAGFYSQIETLSALLKDDRQTVPVRWIADEFNNGLLDAKTADKLAGRQSKSYSTLIPAVAYKLATQGRSKDILGLITSHSPQVKDIELNTSILQSLWLIALGIPGNYGAIEQILDASVGIMTDKSTRLRLSKKFEEVKNSPEAVGKVVALTNVPIDGHSEWRLVFLPDYSKSLGEIQRSAMNQSVAEIVDGGSQASTSAAVEHADPRLYLESLLKQSVDAPYEEPFYAKQDDPETPRSFSSEMAFRLLRYSLTKGKRHADSNGWIEVETLRLNWGKNNGFSAKEFRAFLSAINDAGWGVWQDDSQKFWRSSVNLDQIPG